VFVYFLGTFEVTVSSWRDLSLINVVLNVASHIHRGKTLHKSASPSEVFPKSTRVSYLRWSVASLIINLSSSVLLWTSSLYSRSLKLVGIMLWINLKTEELFLHTEDNWNTLNNGIPCQFSWIVGMHTKINKVRGLNSKRCHFEKPMCDEYVMSWQRNLWKLLEKISMI